MSSHATVNRIEEELGVNAVYAGELFRHPSTLTQ